MHSTTVGGSSASRIINCPGSYQLSKDIPDQESSYAKEGTGLHAAMEYMLLTGDRDVVGKTFEDVLITEDLWQEMLMPALSAFGSITDRFDDEHLDILVEKRVEFPLIPDAFGTADVLFTITNEDGEITRAGIIDWKFGRGVEVSAEDNDQMRFYLRGACEMKPLHKRELERDIWAFSDAGSFEAHIVQPAFGHSEAIYTYNELVAWSAKLQRAFEEAISGAPRYNEGPQCTFCKGRAVCPPKTGRAKQLYPPRVINDLSSSMDMVDELEAWCAEVRKMTHKALEAGETVEGWKLVDKRAMRKWVDEEKTEAWLRKHGVKVGTMMVPKKLRSVAQLEKALKGGPSIPEDQIHKVSSGTTLAREDDPRPAHQSLAGLADVLKQIS